MGQIEDLAKRYERHVLEPWRRTLAPGQRVVVVVYPPARERALRARIGEFRQVTETAKHGWTQVDATGWFAEWLDGDEYREEWFESPDLLAPKMEEEFPRFAAKRLGEALETTDGNSVVALTGVASLYGFLRISRLIAEVEPRIEGKLVVFFPGTKNGTNYRLLGARDGWNYLAQAITLEDEA